MEPVALQRTELGIFMMFARRAGAKPSDSERRALYAAFFLSYAILCLIFTPGCRAILCFCPSTSLGPSVRRC
jgi:hypothetical protein